MKKIFRKENRYKILAVALVIAMVGVCSGTGVFSFADQKTAKDNVNDGTKTTAQSASNDETVYVLTKADGTEKQTIVSECGTLHYSGYEDCTVPVSMNITYELDGKEVSPEQLAGASGHLVMTLNYENQIKRNGVYVPFMAITGMVMDNNHFSNIEVENGKTMDDGSRNIIVGYAFPGMQESIDLSRDKFEVPEKVVVTADVDNYSMDVMYTLVTNKVFEEADFDSIENIGDLEASLKKLSGAADSMVDGTSKLFESTAKLEKYSAQLAAASKTIETNSLKLYKGSAKIQRYDKQLVDGLSQISSNSASLNAGAKQVMDSSIKTADSSLDQLRPAFAQMGKNIPALTADNYSTVLTTVSNTLTAIDQQKGTSDYATVIATLNGAKEQLDSLGQFYNGVLTYTGSVDKAATSAEKIESGQKTLTKGLKALYTGTKEFSGKQKQFAAGMKQLKAGSKELSDGVDKFAKEGLSKLNKLSDSNIAGIISRIKAISNASKEYDSFGGKGQYDSVKFIYKADEVSPK